ncbi:MAG: hypothetical protein J6K38_03205 [Alistipes sp.]|nr:hypothetical protein [Alistipes sp.]
MEIVSKELCANFSSKGVSYNFFDKPDEQSEVYFGFAAARKSACNEAAREKSADGLYSTYCPFADLNEAQEMTPFHEKFTKNYSMV